jgi:hypothetical protein
LSDHAIYLKPGDVLHVLYEGRARIHSYETVQKLVVLDGKLALGRPDRYSQKEVRELKALGGHDSLVEGFRIKSGISRRKTDDTNPKKLLNFARQYFKAAEVVFEHEPWYTRPLNYLYFHTLELALKSFIRANGRNPERSHDIDSLHEEAAALGLAIPGDRYGLQNIVNLLLAGNADHAFRYGTSKGTSEPTLDWMHEVMVKLIAVVEAFVDPVPATTPGTAATFTMVIGKPMRWPG